MDGKLFYAFLDAADSIKKATNVGRSDMFAVKKREASKQTTDGQLWLRDLCETSTQRHHGFQLVKVGEPQCGDHEQSRGFVHEHQRRERFARRHENQSRAERDD